MFSLRNYNLQAFLHSMFQMSFGNPPCRFLEYLENTADFDNQNTVFHKYYKIIPQKTTKGKQYVKSRETLFFHKTMYI